MKKEILVISDNFNEYSKYRSILETGFNTSLRDGFDEVKTFLEENYELIEYIIIDIDDNIYNGLIGYVNLVNMFYLPYIIVIDSLKNIKENLYENSYQLIEDNIVSRQSLYPNLLNLVNYDLKNYVYDNMEDFNDDE